MAETFSVKHPAHTEGPPSLQAVCLPETQDLPTAERASAPALTEPAECPPPVHVPSAHKRRLCLLKALRQYNALEESHQPLSAYWVEILPYVVSNYLDLGSILNLRRVCQGLYFKRRYGVANISFSNWSTLTQEEIMYEMLPQLRTFLTAGSFAQLDFSHCCLLTNSFPSFLMQFDDAKLCAYIKTLKFDFCYALTDKSLEALLSTSLPCLEALSLRCARSRDLTGAPLSTHLSKLRWPKFHQLSIGCTQITLPHLDAAARFVAERAIELNVSPKLGIAGSAASYSLIRRLELDREYRDFIDALINSKSTQIVSQALAQFEASWAVKMQEPEHKNRILHRLMHDRSVPILVNAPCSVTIVGSDEIEPQLKWIVTGDNKESSAVLRRPESSNRKPRLRSCPKCSRPVHPLEADRESHADASDLLLRPPPFQPRNCSGYASDASVPSSFKTSDGFLTECSQTKTGTASRDAVSVTGDLTVKSGLLEPLKSELVHGPDSMSTAECFEKQNTSFYSRWIYPLAIAIRLDDISLVKFLVEKGAQIDVWGYNYATPLYIACSMASAVESDVDPEWAESIKADDDNDPEKHETSTQASENPMSFTHGAHMVQGICHAPNLVPSKSIPGSSAKSPVHLGSGDFGQEDDPGHVHHLLHDRYAQLESDRFTSPATSVVSASYPCSATVKEDLEESSPQEDERLTKQSSICSPQTEGLSQLEFQPALTGTSLPDLDHQSPRWGKTIQILEEQGLPTSHEPSPPEEFPQADLIRRQFTFGIGYTMSCTENALNYISYYDHRHHDSFGQCSCRHQAASSEKEKSKSTSGMQIVRFLLEQGAPVDAPDLYSVKCPVNAAIKHGNLKLLELLIQRHARINMRSLPLESITMLVQHSRRHQQKKKLELHNLSRFGYKSPLFVACEFEAWACVELLLKYGADPHWKDPFSHHSLTPALLAYCRHPGSLKLFLTYRTGCTKATCWVISEILGAAILHDDLPTVEYLISGHPELLEQGSNGMWSLPLMQASSLDKVEIVRKLIDLGANPNATNSEGLTALHIAANEGRRTVVKCLLENGALPNVKGGIYGKTPLHVAVEENYVELIFPLMDYGADITIKDNAGHTPLMTAIAARNDKVALQLIERASVSSLDVVDASGRTALMYAIYFGQFKVANALVEKGVHCKPTDVNGFSAESLLRAKIDSMGKSTSALNKFIRNIVGGGATFNQQTARKQSDSYIQYDDGQAETLSAEAVREMNAKRKKIAKSLLKKIKAFSTSKKPIRTAASDPVKLVKGPHPDPSDIAPISKTQDKPTDPYDKGTLTVDEGYSSTSSSSASDG